MVAWGRAAVKATGPAAAPVTGDGHLLALGTYEQAEIVSPVRFLAQLSLEG